MIHEKSASSMWLYLCRQLGIATIGHRKFNDYVGDDSSDIDQKELCVCKGINKVITSSHLL